MLALAFHQLPICELASHGALDLRALLLKLKSSAVGGEKELIGHVGDTATLAEQCTT